MAKLTKTIGGREFVLFSYVENKRNYGSQPDIRVQFNKNGYPWVKSGRLHKNETEQEVIIRFFKELRVFILGGNGTLGLADEANWSNRAEIELFFNEFQEMLKSQPFEKTQ